MIECDYFVIGMGIAGISLAHNLSGNVIISDPNPFSYKIGESHIPSILHADLNILELIPEIKEIPSFSTKKGTIFADSKSQKYENMIFTELKDLYAFHVQRSHLEKFLVEKLNIDYIKEFVEDIDLEAGIVFTNKNTYKVKKYILDCSGPRKLIANKLGTLKTLDHWGQASAKRSYWDIKDIDSSQKKVGDYTLLNHIEDGIWLWQIPLYDKSILSVGIISLNREISDEEYTQLVTEYKHSYYNSVKLRKGDDELSKIYNRKGFSQSSTVSSGEKFILVGDAYSFTDPVFSIGTGAAISEAVYVAKKLNNNTFSSIEYDKKCQKVLDTFIASFQLWYNDGWKDKYNLSLIQKNALQGNILKDTFHNLESTLASYITLVTGLEKMFVGNHQGFEHLKQVIIYFASENYLHKDQKLFIGYIGLNGNDIREIEEESIRDFFYNVQGKVFNMYELYELSQSLEESEREKLSYYLKELVDNKIIPTYYRKSS